MASYADIRKQELEFIEQELQSDKKMKEALQGIYTRSSKDIERQIEADIMKFATDEGVSMAEGKRIIDKTDVEAFNETVKRILDRPDISKQAKRELKRYNVTMRTNRLEYLKARVNAELVTLAIDEENETLDNIAESYLRERERQAGILGMTLPSKQKMRTMARAVALSDVSGTTFSDRIWANQNEMRGNVNRTIERALIRGQHPRTATAEIAKSVRKDVRNKRYVAERIAITETARAQTIAQRESFKEAEIEYYMYIAESDACPTCEALDGEVFRVDEMQTGVNAPFMHPHCRCSTAGYVAREDEEPKRKPPEEPQKPQERPKPEPETKASIPFKRATTVAEANAYVKDTLGLPDANYKGVDIEIANEWNEGLRDSFERFPELRDRLQFVGSAQERNKKLKPLITDEIMRTTKVLNPNASDEAIERSVKKQVTQIMRKFSVSQYTQAQSFFSKKDPILRQINGVTLNAKNASSYTVMKKQIERDVDQGWGPKGADTPRAILDHEIGHQIDEMLGIGNKAEIQDLYDSRTRQQIKDDLSEYSWNHSNPDRYSEMIAEGWAEYVNSDEPREMARTIGEIIEAEYEVKYGRNRR